MPVLVRTRQISHLGTTVTPPVTRRYPSNLENEVGFYHRVWVEGGNVRYARSDNPTPPFIINLSATGFGGDTAIVVGGERLAINLLALRIVDFDGKRSVCERRFILGIVSGLRNPEFELNWLAGPVNGRSYTISFTVPPSSGVT